MESKLIDVLLTRDHVILSRGAHSLWCGRKDGKLMPSSELLTDTESSVALGSVWGCIGKIKFFSDADWKLLLVSAASSVGVLPQGGEVYCIEKVALISLTTDSPPEIIGLETPDSTESAVPRPHSPVPTKKATRGQRDLRDREKLERRLTEALLWMFTDSRSFYFCLTADLTQSLQRQLINTELQALPLWQRVDERFFWNKVMLSDLIEDNYAGAIADPWILPVIQGYVEIRQIPILSEEPLDHLQVGGCSSADPGQQKKRDSELAEKKEDDIPEDGIVKELVGQEDKSGQESVGSRLIATLGEVSAWWSKQEFLTMLAAGLPVDEAETKPFSQ